MRTNSFFATVGWALAACSAGSQALAQFPAPANARIFEDTGTFEGIQGDVMQIRDSKSEPWLLKIVRDTKINLDGEAERECLRPGVFVQFKGEIDKKGALQAPLQEIEITSALGKTSLGLFPADDAADAKNVRAVTAGTYLIKGKLATLRDGEFLVLAGRHKITGSLSDDELKVKLNLDDVGLAQPGDEVKVKVWHYDFERPNLSLGRAGKAMAEEIKITLKEPLKAGGKKARPTERPTRATSRSKVSK